MPRLLALFALVAAALTLSADPGDDILKKLTIPPAPPLVSMMFLGFTSRRITFRAWRYDSA